MTSFSDIESEFGTQPVNWLDHAGNSIALLTLNGQESKLVVSSPDFHFLRGDYRGWLDMQLVDRKGDQILVHNALPGIRRMPMTRNSQRVGNYTTEVFPNYIILKSQNLGQNNSVSRICFEFAGADKFFHVDLIKSLYTHELSDEEAKLLKDIGKKSTPPGKLDPLYLYSIEKPKARIRFKVDDRTYSVVHGIGGEGLGWPSISIRISSILSIQFDGLVSIETATSRVWEWLGYFNQLGMQSHNLISLSAYSSTRSRDGADFYLPNLRQELPHRRLSFNTSVANLPYSLWKDRNRFGALMKRWLELADQRRFFRAALNRVVSELNERQDHVDIVLLCSAIESLDELSNKGTTLQQMIEAAGNTVSLFSQNIDWEEFSKKAKKLRNDVAHGHWLDDRQIQSGTALVEVLASVCALYDQVTAGMTDIKASKSQMAMVTRLEENWLHFKHLQHQ